MSEHYPDNYPELVVDSTFHDGTSLVSLKVWSDLPEYIRQDLRDIAMKLAVSYPDLDVHIEADRLNATARTILEKHR